MLEDYSKLAIGNLKRKKIRSSLTIIGIFISIATIFILLSLSLGLDSAVKEQFRILGTDKLSITPKGQIGSTIAVNFTKDDALFVEKISGVKDITYYVFGNAEIKLNNEKKYYNVFAFDPKKMNVYTKDVVKVEEGRLFKEGETGKILVGNNFKTKNIFKRPVKIGDKIFINNKEFEVICIRKFIGNPQEDNEIDMTYKDYQDLYNSGDRIDGFLVQIKPGENINKVADEIKKRLMKKRDVTEKTIDFNIETPEELLSSYQDILNIITTFLLGVAAISILVGSIGIANTMYTSVLERTKEIGIMKAIGAKNSDILKIFVIESGFLGLMGGIIGVLFGYIISKTIEFIAVNYYNTTLLKVATPVWLFALCLSFAFIIGTVSGLLPAMQASKIKPADTLRYE
jgi:putative ABC transport system permease protein